MRCPYCSDSANRVIDSRLGRERSEIRRRRECLECGRRFTTRERIDGETGPVPGARLLQKPLSLEKLLAEVRRALDA